MRGGAAWSSREGHIVRPAVRRDAIRLAPLLRQADRAEIQASSGLPAQVALQACLAASEAAYAVTHRDSGPDGAPLAMFGVAPHPLGADVAAPWLLAAVELPKVSRAMLREAPAWITRLSAGRMLCNFADERNHLHLRWLALLGFSRLRRVERCGPEARPFIEFVKLPST
ncbi:MAG: hypothetical protein MRY74_05800 [Neomegalonema sp.]|nr:hypothetical protein [Neomegalonema sp.]